MSAGYWIKRGFLTQFLCKWLSKLTGIFKDHACVQWLILVCTALAPQKWNCYYFWWLITVQSSDEDQNNKHVDRIMIYLINFVTTFSKIYHFMAILKNYNNLITENILHHLVCTHHYHYTAPNPIIWMWPHFYKQ